MAKLGATTICGRYSATLSSTRERLGVTAGTTSWTVDILCASPIKGAAAPAKSFIAGAARAPYLALATASLRASAASAELWSLLKKAVTTS
jgi:hypothetical protein